MSGLGEHPSDPGYEPVPAQVSGCQDADKQLLGLWLVCTPA